jgi:hypothetical protein
LHKEDTLKKFRSLLPLAAAVLVMLLIGCAAGDVRWNQANPAGFWAGLWHGLIILFTFIISLFSKSVKIYETFNNGGWYNFGFLLGIIIFWGSGSGTVCSRRKKNKRAE